MFSSKKSRKLLITNCMTEAFDFIITHENVKMKTINFKMKPKVLTKPVFLEMFWEETKDKYKLFYVANILVKGSTNFIAIVTKLNLNEEFKTHKKHYNLR